MTDIAQPKVKAPVVKAPIGACDTHMHFYSPDFQHVPNANLPSYSAWVDDYKVVRETLGLQRVVVVQPSAYGLDSSCQLAAMAAFGSDARGVMVVDRDTPDEELERLTGLGVRGARFHMLPGGLVPWEQLEEVAARIDNFGWHIQLQLNGRELPDHAALLKRLPCPLVVDHIGRFTPPVAADHKAFRVLLGLIEDGKCWVKLSAPYESSQSGAPRFVDVKPEVEALVAAAPERMLWASNWPHPGQKSPISHAATLDLLTGWVPDEKTRRLILVDNPAEVYGF